MMAAFLFNCRQHDRKPCLITGLLSDHAERSGFSQYVANGEALKTTEAARSGAGGGLSEADKN
jgi:hypothetical protein